MEVLAVGVLKKTLKIESGLHRQVPKDEEDKKSKKRRLKIGEENLINNHLKQVGI